MRDFLRLAPAFLFALLAMNCYAASIKYGSFFACVLSWVAMCVSLRLSYRSGLARWEEG